MRGHCRVGRWVHGLRHARFRVFFHRRRHTSRLRQCVGVSWHLVQWIVGGQGFEVSWRGCWKVLAAAGRPLLEMPCLPKKQSVSLALSSSSCAGCVWQYSLRIVVSCGPTLLDHIVVAGEGWKECVEGALWYRRSLGFGVCVVVASFSSSVVSSRAVLKAVAVRTEVSDRVRFTKESLSSDLFVVVVLFVMVVVVVVDAAMREIRGVHLVDTGRKSGEIDTRWWWCKRDEGSLGSCCCSCVGHGRTLRCCEYQGGAEVK